MVAIRLPVRIVALVVVVPLRLVWDALVVAGRFLLDTALRPVGRALAWLGRTLVLLPLGALWTYVLAPVGRGLAAAGLFLGKCLFVWPWVGLWRYVVVPVGLGLGRLLHLLLVVPAGWLYRYVLTPIGHAIAWAARGVGAGGKALGRGVRWLLRMLFVVPAAALYRYVLTPVGHAVAWVARGIGAGLMWLGAGIVWLLRGIGFVVGTLLRWIFVVPAVAVWRWVLAPIGRGIAVVAREIGDALGHAWRVAGHVSRAVWRFFGQLLRWIFVSPARWVYRSVLTPAGHAVRDLVWRPAADAARAVGRATRQALATARQSVRQARADVRRALFGGSRERTPVDRVPQARREPDSGRGRTLDPGTTALTKD